MASTSSEQRPAEKDTWRLAMDRDCANGNVDCLYGSIFSLRTSLSEQWISYGTDSKIPELEEQCHRMWYSYIQVAKYTAADSAMQDQHAAQILVVRQAGSLCRIVDGRALETSDGVVWTDLPFLVGDFKEAWNGSGTLILEHRVNLAAFMARLISVGVKSKELSICALWSFRDALENQTSETDDKDTRDKRMYESLSVVETWLRHAKLQLVLMLNGPVDGTQTQGIATNGDDTGLGDLAIEAGITEPGYSISRWKFWRAKLLEISQSQVSEEVRDKAKRGAHMMYKSGLQVTSVLREYSDPSSPFLNIQKVERK